MPEAKTPEINDECREVIPTLQVKRLPAGIYEDLITDELDRAIQEASVNGAVPLVRTLPKGGDAALVSRWVQEIVERYLRNLPNEARAEAQVEVANRLVQTLLDDSEKRKFRKEAVTVEDRLHGAEILEQILPDVHARDFRRPVTPLGIPDLLTGTHGEPSLGEEYKAEMESADRMDALVSFVTKGGWFQLKDSLIRLSDRHNPSSKEPIIRFITTTYMGNTDADALLAIARLPGAEVRVSMDPRRSRLHAKAWLFERNSRLHTAYIGSANLSKAALGSGVEWTLKITQKDSPHLIDKFRATFESLWLDPEFELINPDDAELVTRLRTVLNEQAGKANSMELPISLRLHPLAYQQAILEQLDNERSVYGRMRNLVVAATGTGKTVVAALDYARQVKDPNQPPRLLFVAHREELLDQARKTFRIALRDGSFGEMLVGGDRPSEWRHVFASIQSLRQSMAFYELPSNHWDMVIIDEFHHAAAPSYQKLLDWITPRLLLGLTATPERTDGLDIAHWFGGRMAAEIRLWDALDQQILVPFQYFGVADGVDLNDVAWERGDYSQKDLDFLYRNHRDRAALVITKFQEIHSDYSKARAIGFCAGVAHAEFMAKMFIEAGIAAKSINGQTPDEERKKILNDLRKGVLRAVFACDLLNEGIDIPEVDTLFFLRPTASATVFQQQLGRGLRLSAGKEYTLVIDFVGRARREFRFDRPLSVMTGMHRKQLLNAFDGGRVPRMPRGCTMYLDRQAREDLMDNLKEHLQYNIRKIRIELKNWLSAKGHPQEPDLLEFMADTGVDLDDIWSTSAGGWTPLLRSVNALDQVDAVMLESETRWSKALGHLLHSDDAEQLQFLSMLSRTEVLHFPNDLLSEKRFSMFWFQTMGKSSGVNNLVLKEQFFGLWQSSRFRQDLGALCQILLQNAHKGMKEDSIFQGNPLVLNCRYGRREILTALGVWTWDTQPEWREGVKHIPSQYLDVFVVTLEKDEKHFSPTTRYEDRAISPDLFHWKSQSGTSGESNTGSRYQTIGKGVNRAILFVREKQSDAYLFLGEIEYLRHEGSRPMGIDFRLKRSMPAKDFNGWVGICAA